MPSRAPPARPAHHRFVDIGANLTDGMFRGVYHGKAYHDADLEVVLRRAWDAGVEKIIITEAQKGNTISTVRTYLTAYRQKVGIPQNVRLPAGWVANIFKEHFVKVEKPANANPKIKTPVKQEVE